MAAENELVKEIMDYRYVDEKINQLVRNFKKTKKNRIKNKKFKQIFEKALEERKVIKALDVVVLDYEVYRSMIEEKSRLEIELESTVLDLLEKKQNKIGTGE